jgi:hypothetical protein
MVATYKQNASQKLPRIMINYIPKREGTRENH